MNPNIYFATAAQVAQLAAQAARARAFQGSDGWNALYWKCPQCQATVSRDVSVCPVCHPLQKEDRTMSLRGKGYIVLSSESTNVAEHATIEEATDEAVAQFVRSGKSARVIIYAPVGSLMPRLDPQTEVRFTSFGAELKRLGAAMEEVDQTLREAPKEG